MKKSMLIVLAVVIAAGISPLFAAGNQAAPAQAVTQKITYWCQLADGIVSANFSNLGDTPFAKGLMEKTGITIEFLHPASGAGTEQFNLIVASGELPDIME